jgi:hypothetical protein
MVYFLIHTRNLSEPENNFFDRIMFLFDTKKILRDLKKYSFGQTRIKVYFYRNNNVHVLAMC